MNFPRSADLSKTPQPDRRDLHRALHRSVNRAEPAPVMRYGRRRSSTAVEHEALFFEAHEYAVEGARSEDRAVISSCP